MGRPRLELQAIFLTFVPNVYFQPPSDLVMQYPCIRYERDNADTEFADDIPYRVIRKYQVTVIDRDPDSIIPGKVAALPTALHNRSYPADDLNHDVYTLFF